MACHNNISLNLHANSTKLDESAKKEHITYPYTYQRSSMDRNARSPPGVVNNLIEEDARVLHIQEQDVAVPSDLIDEANKETLRLDLPEEKLSLREWIESSHVTITNLLTSVFSSVFNNAIAASYPCCPGSPKRTALRMRQ